MCIRDSINYFLEKRKIDDIRTLELTSLSRTNIQNGNAEEETLAKNLNKASFEERKSIQKEIKQAEKKIELLEIQISNLESEMQMPEFHTNADSIEKLKMHVELKKQLDDWMDKWTVFQEKLEFLP